MDGLKDLTKAVIAESLHFLNALLEKWTGLAHADAKRKGKREKANDNNIKYQTNNEIEKLLNLESGNQRLVLALLFNYLKGKAQILWAPMSCTRSLQTE